MRGLMIRALSLGIIDMHFLIDVESGISKPCLPHFGVEAVRLLIDCRALRPAPQ